MLPWASDFARDSARKIEADNDLADMAVESAAVGVKGDVPSGLDTCILSSDAAHARTEAFDT